RLPQGHVSDIDLVLVGEDDQVAIPGDRRKRPVPWTAVKRYAGQLGRARHAVESIHPAVRIAAREHVGGESRINDITPVVRNIDRPPKPRIPVRLHACIIHAGAPGKLTLCHGSETYKGCKKGETQPFFPQHDLASNAVWMNGPLSSAILAR